MASRGRRIGIDLGGTAVKAGAVTGGGEVQGEARAEVSFERGPGEVLDTIAGLFRRLGGGDALGAGVPGLLERESGRVVASPNLPGFSGVAVRDELARRTGLPPAAVRIENDANCAALGEQWLGAARGERDALVVTLGTGIGGGLILGGELYTGAGMAGELGHVVVDPRGPPCGCGARGCAETLSSASAARRRALEAGLPRGAPGDLELLVRGAREGSADERRLLAEIGRDLGRAIGVVVCLLDVRLCVVGGGFGAALDQLEPGIREGIDERSYGMRGAAMRIVPAKLGSSAGWIGAARLVRAPGAP
ncbi:MAG TPA: ROK family protein [Planctomycetota bacterium]|nr:ROK family protein [Planctomycetota bacterium]